MSFSGVAVVQQITDRKVRITGLSLPLGGQDGSIGLFGDLAVDVQLPDAFIPRVNNFQGEVLDLAALIEVSYVVTTDVNVAVPVSISKNAAPFQIGFHNDTSDEGGFPTGELEIYVSYVGQF
jgi:hypothetical protein